MTEDYIEKSIEELNKGHVNQVVKTDLIIGVTMRNLLIKLLNLLKHKGVLTQEEIEGIASEAFDARVWDKEKLEQRYQERLTEIDAQIKKLEMRVKEIDDSKKQK